MYRYISKIQIDTQGMQTDTVGKPGFPISSYEGDLDDISVIWHWHDELELMQVMRGNIRIKVGSEAVNLEKGSGCFIKAGALHSAVKCDAEGGAYHSIVFHSRLIGSRDSVFWQKYLRPLEEKSYPQMVCFLKKQDDEILSLIRRAWEYDVAEGEGYEADVRYFLTKVICHLTSRAGTDIRQPSAREMRDMERVKAMLEYMERHFNENVTIPDIAAHAMISESECLRCFKRVTGLTPIRFIKEFRIRRAADMLSEGELSVSEIAGQCGFTDMSYFSKSFRQILKQTPTEYRAVKGSR